MAAGSLEQQSVQYLQIGSVPLRLGISPKQHVELGQVSVGSNYAFLSSGLKNLAPMYSNMIFIGSLQKL